MQLTDFLDNAFPGAAVFTHTETDENGEERVIVMRAAPSDVTPAPARHVPALRVIARVDETPAVRAKVWRHNPYCCECDARIITASAGAVVPTEEGPRLACRDTCFAPAMQRHQPSLSVGVVLGKIARRSSTDRGR